MINARFYYYTLNVLCFGILRRLVKTQRSNLSNIVVFQVFPPATILGIGTALQYSATTQRILLRKSYTYLIKSPKRVPKRLAISELFGTINNNNNNYNKFVSRPMHYNILCTFGVTLVVGALRAIHIVYTNNATYGTINFSRRRR